MPEVWPSINIPTHMAGRRYTISCTVKAESWRDAILLYYSPYLATTIKHYDPLTFYDRLIELNLARASGAMLLRRLVTGAPLAIQFVNAVRTFDTWLELRELRRIRLMLASDAQFRAFHEGRSKTLPTFYASLFERRLGRFAELLPPDDSPS